MRFLACIAWILFSATSGFALEPPKVVVTYSLDCSHGGRFERHITDTPLGLGNQTFVLCLAEDESSQAQVYNVDPATITIEYTADSTTQEIADGPVELTDLDFHLLFDIFALNGAATTTRDIEEVAVRSVLGTLTGNVITWDNAIPFQTSQTGETNCFGNATICSLAAPPGGWPRIEDGTPKSHHMPLYEMQNNLTRADAFVGNNQTPLDFTDDYLEVRDSQATVYDTWGGAEIARQYVSEPVDLILLLTGVSGLLGIRKTRAQPRAASSYCAFLSQDSGDEADASFRLSPIRLPRDSSGRRTPGDRLHKTGPAPG